MTRDITVTLGVTLLSHGPRSLTWFKLAWDKKPPERVDHGAMMGHMGHN